MNLNITEIASEEITNHGNTDIATIPETQDMKSRKLRQTYQQK